MPDDPLLTEAELEFIQDVLEKAPSPRPAPSPGLQVDAGRQLTELLAHRATQEQLTIDARFENQRLTFTPQLVEDAQHEPHLTLGTPQIFEEEGPSSRAWRLTLDPPLALRDRNDTHSALWVHELSMTGLRLENRGGSDAPRTFSLRLPLNTDKHVDLLGVFVRETDDGLLAYRLEITDQHDSDCLRRFIYQQHRALFPKAHRPG